MPETLIPRVPFTTRERPSVEEAPQEFALVSGEQGGGYDTLALDRAMIMGLPFVIRDISTKSNPCELSKPSLAHKLLQRLSPYSRADEDHARRTGLVASRLALVQGGVSYSIKHEGYLRFSDHTRRHVDGLIGKFFQANTVNPTHDKEPYSGIIVECHKLTERGREHLKLLAERAKSKGIVPNSRVTFPENVASEYNIAGALEGSTVDAIYYFIAEYGDTIVFPSGFDPDGFEPELWTHEVRSIDPVTLMHSQGAQSTRRLNGSVIYKTGSAV